MGYFTESIHLIEKIRVDAQNKNLINAIVENKVQLKRLSNRIRNIDMYKKKIQIDADDYYLKMIEKKKNENIKEYLFSIIYLDLIDKLKKSNFAQQLMSIVLLLPLIDRALDEKA